MMAAKVLVQTRTLHAHASPSLVCAWACGGCSICTCLPACQPPCRLDLSTFDVTMWSIDAIPSHSVAVAAVQVLQ